MCGVVPPNKRRSMCKDKSAISGPDSHSPLWSPAAALSSQQGDMLTAQHVVILGVWFPCACRSLGVIVILGVWFPCVCRSLGVIVILGVWFPCVCRSLGVILYEMCTLEHAYKGEVPEGRVCGGGGSVWV